MSEKSSGDMFPANKPGLSGKKLLKFFLSSAVVAGVSAVGIGYYVSHSNPFKQSPKSPLDVSASEPVATILVPPETEPAPVAAHALTAQSAPAPMQSVPSAASSAPILGLPTVAQSLPVPVAVSSAPVASSSSPVAVEPKKDSATEATEKQLAAFDARLTQIEAQLLEIKSQTSNPVAQVRRPGVVSRIYRKRPQRALAKANVQREPKQADEQLVSIDYWGGKPSVVLKGKDGAARFVSEGDAIGGGRITDVRSDNGLVTVVKPDGSREVMKLRERH